VKFCGIAAATISDWDVELHCLCYPMSNVCHAAPSRKWHLAVSEAGHAESKEQSAVVGRTGAAAFTIKTGARSGVVQRAFC
jgi:hypothetical protein